MQIICKNTEIVANTGVCALVGAAQVAIFKVLTASGEESLYAIDNFDPFSQANVLSRGLIGSVGEAFYVASPVYKHRFNLQTGQCLDDATVCLKTYAVKTVGDQVLVG